MIRPQGYRQAAAEQCFLLMVAYLPFWQSVLLAGISGVVSWLLLTCLLLFVVERSPAIGRVLASGLQPLALILPDIFGHENRSGWSLALQCSVPVGPVLAPLFQRPPPLFS